MHSDIRYMRTALGFARRNLGQTWPNPAVGAVLVRGDQIMAASCTARSGRPHAETLAIAQAGSNAKGSTLYVTLEPCAHQGQTPPCTQAIIKAGIPRVVIACRDSNPLVNGKGIAQLKDAGIEVTENIGEAEAREINRGFFSVIEHKRPYVALKIATSSDGKISGGPSRWITGEAARAFAHLLRSRYDAIATGIGTVLADDPLLTVRLPGLEDRSPVRLVFDSELRIPPASKLMKTASEAPLWLITRKAQATLGGTKILRCVSDDIGEALQLLAAEGITRLLVEGGHKLNTAFLKSGMVDRIYWFRAPGVIGETGLPAVEGDLNATLGRERWRVIQQCQLATDNLELLEKAA
jgi:diaminohydroxyphosphoribosylaminopyrimidine deaminase / 5-amino-6-(5-phosphoribosylamino)uracil reductase